MSSTNAPARPRLGNHVLARRHVIDGESAVILFDASSDEVLRVGEREWAILAAADGTRDVEGVVIAAARQGSRVEVAEAEAFLQALTQRGLVVDEPEVSSLTPAAQPPAERPVVPLPAYGLTCDRSGRCCRMYSTVLVANHEAERARALLPDRTFGRVPTARAFLPVRGSIPGSAVAVIANDGACGYLDPDGACAIHRAAGAAAKPAGCRVFPAVFIDDGDAVRVSIKTECGCVLDSVDVEGGEPLVDPAVVQASDLPIEIVVSQLRSTLAVAPDVVATRRQVVDFVSAWLQRDAGSDPARACWAASEAAPRGLAAALEAADAAATPPAPERVAPFLAAMARRSGARIRVDARWRSAKDRVRRIGEWIARTAVTCREPEITAEILALGPSDARREAFFVRAALYGYAPFGEDLVDLQHGLKDLAVKLWVARAMPTFATEAVDGEDALTSLEAWLRAYGGWRYILDA
ncbi:MAG: YkgJ family cysteine cluster protein [Myxococcota bacterium]